MLSCDLSQPPSRPIGRLPGLCIMQEPVRCHHASLLSISLPLGLHSAQVIADMSRIVPVQDLLQDLQCILPHSEGLLLAVSAGTPHSRRS